MIDSKELAKLNIKLNKIGRDLLKTSVEIPNEITRELAVGANDIRNTIIRSMKDTKRAPWSYKRGRKKHYPSAPGEPPAIDFGELVRSIMFDVRSMEIEIGSWAGAPYAEFLETGTKKMKARPWLDPAVEKHRQAIIDRVGDGVFEMILKPFEKI